MLKKFVSPSRERTITLMFLLTIIMAATIPNNYKENAPWCIGYRRRKWTRRHEFKSWTRLIAFHIALTPLGMNPIILPPAMG